MFKLINAVMNCFLLPCIAAVVACNPPPKEAAMPNPRPVSESEARESRQTDTNVPGSTDPRPTGRGTGVPEQDSRASLPEPASAAVNPAPGRRGDSPAEAEGRRTLSTAFVMMGPDGHLTVELRDGRSMVLRDVVMRARDYCGVQALGGSAGKTFCGGYGDVAAARPGGGPTPGTPDPRTLDPAGTAGGPSGGE